MILADIKNIVPVDKIYEDALSPAMKQIGKSLESVAKTSRFLLAPFTYLAAQHDRWERHLTKVSEKVESENLTEGHPQLVIPILEGLSLATEGSLLSELFINLLANSIDKTKQDLAHPAFPNIINQLSHDEAVILYYLKKQDYKLTFQSDWDSSRRLFIKDTLIIDTFPKDKLSFPQHMMLYMNHLNSLNLAGTYEDGNQLPIMDPNTNNQIGVYVHQKRTLNEFGHLFSTACIPDEFEGLSL